MNATYGAAPPASPGLPTANYERPLPKQSQSNTIVPNKSTMVEEDDGELPSPMSDANGGAFGLDRGKSDRDSLPSPMMDRNVVQTEVERSHQSNPPPTHMITELSLPSQNDKRLMDDYEAQIRSLRDKLNLMDNAMRNKTDELNSLLDGERARATAANLERKEWADARADLESQLADARNLNESLRDEMDRTRDDHAAEARQLRAQMDDLRESANNSSRLGGGDAELERENQELRAALRDQQQVTDDVRREAQEFLREMRILSQQSGSTWEKQAELEKTIESLEQEVRDWRNRYARTKTQLRNLRASSIGLTIDQDAGKYVREKGFTTDNGMVKDVHVTKFQIAIDELLRRARIEDPEKAIDSMKAVVVSVRRITKDIDEAAPLDEELAQQQAKLKGTRLLHGQQPHHGGQELCPVGRHLARVATRRGRVRPRRRRGGAAAHRQDQGHPSRRAGRRRRRNHDARRFDRLLLPPEQRPDHVDDHVDPRLPRPAAAVPGLGGGRNRDSADSSTYSPISSPRESVERYPAKRPMSQNNGMMGNGNGNGNANGKGMGYNKGLPPAPNGFGMRRGPDRRAEDLKVCCSIRTTVTSALSILTNLPNRFT